VLTALAPVSAADRVLGLPIWQGEVQVSLLSGGTTNVNFLVQDDVRRCVVRIGDDIPVHQILRFNERAASQAAHAAGVSPAVVFHAPGVLVIDFIEGRTLTAADLRQDAMLEQALALIRRAHHGIPNHLHGAALMFWVFHVIRDYAATLTASPCALLLGDMLAAAARLEAAVGPVDIVYGHNDLLPANFIHDGSRLWLIDWDYAGFNSPLFDLGGLAANAALSAAQEARMLESYFQRRADTTLWRAYLAMKAAAALREALWSMVSERHSDIDFDFATYTQTNLARWRAALDVFDQT